MATKIGAKVELAGEREFRKALSDINTGLRTTASELTLVSAKYSDNANSVSALTAKSTALQAKLEQQTGKVSTLRGALENAKREYGETDIKTLKWQQSLNLAETELIKTEKEIKDNSEALQQAQKDMKQYGLTTDEVADKSSGFGNIIADLAGKIGIKLTPEVEESVRSLGSQMTAAEKSKITTAALATVVVGLAVGFGKLTIKTAQAADEILTMATTTGLTTDTIQELNYASELLDVSTETITGSMTKMIKNMNNARMGSKQSEEAFKALRIRIKESNGELRDAETVFGETIDKLGRIRNETERDAVAMQIFGRSARELTPLIEAGSGSLKAFAAEAHEMGYIMSGDTLESFGALDDAMQRFNNQTEAFKNSIAVVLLPVITSFFELLNKIDPKVLATVAVVASVAVTAITVVKAIKNVTDTFKVMDAAAWKTTGIVIGVTAALIALVAIIGVLAGKGGEMEKAMASIGKGVGDITNTVNTAPERLQRVGRNALGTSNWRGGLTWVGEEGPELVELPAGAKVYDNRRSTQMVQQRSTGNTYNINVTIPAKDLTEMKNINDFFNRIQPTARSMA
jgi:predicted  nucleic acid-binding Zn-ribbon protein